MPGGCGRPCHVSTCEVVVDLWFELCCCNGSVDAFEVLDY